MKFLTIAAICALASSVSSLQFFGHLADPIQPHQNGQKDHPHGNDDHGHGHGDKKGATQFDWKTWTNPCPNKDDKTCWQQYFSTQLPCKTDDKQCWGDSLKKLPCCVADRKCWTDHVDTFPCKKDDKACWNSVLPTTLPCKAEDRGCWRKLVFGDKGGKKGGKRH